MATVTTDPNDTARVSLDGITKTYGDLYAVRDVNLEIREHEFISLLGPSGSGKTTILMILAGFVQADSGSVRIDGQDITRIRQAYGPHSIITPYMPNETLERLFSFTTLRLTDERNN